VAVYYTTEGTKLLKQFNSRFISLLALLLVSLSPFLPEARSQGSSTIQRTWGTRLNDLGKAVATDSQGNIYVTGLYNATGDYLEVKLLLLKYDAEGNLLWARSWQDNSSGDGYSVAVGDYGSVVIGGETCISGCGPLLMKLDASGNLVWANTWIHSNPLFIILGIASDSSGNVYVTGTKAFVGLGPDSRIFVMKFDPAGNVVWQIDWVDGYHYSESRSTSVRGGGIYVGGTSYGHGATLLKLNSTGGIVWQKNWQDNESRTFATATDSSENVYITGITDFGGVGNCQGHPCQQAFILKFTPEGGLVCQRIWGDSSADNFSQGIATDSQGNVFVSGYTGTVSNMNDTFLLKMDSSCNLIWSKTWGGPKDDFGYGVATDSVGTVIMTGSVGEAPPYSLKVANSTLGAVNFPAMNATGTISAESAMHATPAGSLFIPSGKQTYAGGSELFILRPDEPFTPASIPPLTPVVIALATIFLLRTRRIKMRPVQHNAKTKASQSNPVPSTLA
jgi:beta-propeller repeat-containing protein